MDVSGGFPRYAEVLQRAAHGVDRKPHLVGPEGADATDPESGQLSLIHI